MSTFNKNSSGKRLAQLATSQQTLFHMDDLALLFSIHNKNTLRVTLRRYVQDGLLYRVQRGLYSLLPPEKIDPRQLGAACLHQYCYLSAETVLRDAGYILQSFDAYTFFSCSSKRCTVLGHRYIFRQMHERFLHHPAGKRNEGGIVIASPERAIADLLYIDPWYHFDRDVDWPTIRLMQEDIGFPLTPHRYAHSAHA